MGEQGVDTVKEQLIRDYVAAYREVYYNLMRHAPGYSHSDTLLARIKRGNPLRGPDHIGEGSDTEASDWIIRVVDEAGERPVHVAIWGGQTDLVQALWKVKHTRNLEGYGSFISKLRIYDINDQDGLYGFVRKMFPELFYILADAPEGTDRPEGAYRGMYLGGDDEDITAGVTSARSAVSRWKQAFRNDFEARMDWCVKPLGEANHNPVAVVQRDETESILYVDAAEGDTLTISAMESYDPDGGRLEFTWWNYPEAGSNLHCPMIEDNISPEVSFIVPYGESGADLHLICEIKDNGSPPLTDYRRIVIRIY
jgi:hypothetical protein